VDEASVQLETGPVATLTAPEPRPAPAPAPLTIEASAETTVETLAPLPARDAPSQATAPGPAAPVPFLATHAPDDPGPEAAPAAPKPRRFWPFG
jgi:hypothetical protein